MRDRLNEAAEYFERLSEQNRVIGRSIEAELLASAAEGVRKALADDLLKQEAA